MLDSLMLMHSTAYPVVFESFSKICLRWLLGYSRPLLFFALSGNLEIRYASVLLQVHDRTRIWCDENRY